MSLTLLEAYEAIAHSHELARRLDAAAGELAKRPGLAEEKTWLEAARGRLARAREGIGDILDRAVRLEELEPMRAERARMLQGRVVDALERFHAAIVFAGSPRSPLLEVLFTNVKLPLLRKLDRDELERAWADFEKRLGSSYAKRMLADETYAGVVEPLNHVRRALATWRNAFDVTPLPEAEARALSDELLAKGERLDLPSRQARLLAQAALLSTREILDEHGLAPKPKRRGAPDPDTHPVLEQDPPDPHDPTPEERAELEATNADVAAPSETARDAGGESKRGARRRA